LIRAQRAPNQRRAQKDAAGALDRAERLRRARASAPLVRETFPEVPRISVRLRFPNTEEPAHAEQSFVLYPGARAHFGYPCPFGDCDGIYDLGAAAEAAARNPTHQLRGTLECSGLRSRNRIPGQLCGLQVQYRVSLST
jgi:hypothetical protein